MAEHVCQDGCEAYRLFGTPDELELEAMENDLHEMSFGLIAWRAIAFALERDVPLPQWVRGYLRATAKGVDDWAALGGHPGELKSILALDGKRIRREDWNDPRWIYQAISQLREITPKATVLDLVQEYMKQYPEVSGNEEAVRQKYYQGKKLAETGQDYKGRGRKRDLESEPMIAAWQDVSDIDF